MANAGLSYHSSRPPNMPDDATWPVVGVMVVKVNAVNKVKGWRFGHLSVKHALSARSGSLFCFKGRAWCCGRTGF